MTVYHKSMTGTSTSTSPQLIQTHTHQYVHCTHLFQTFSPNVRKNKFTNHFCMHFCLAYISPSLCIDLYFFVVVLSKVENHFVSCSLFIFVCLCVCFFSPFSVSFASFELIPCVTYLYTFLHD